MLFTGVSERARRKLNRSASQSSSEHSQDGRLSPEPQFTNDSPANRRKPERPPPPGPGAVTNKEPGPKSSFFDTLDWQHESEGLIHNGNTEWTSHNRQRYDSVDEEFGKLSVGRVQSAAGEDGEENNFFNERPRDTVNIPEDNFFEADFSNRQEFKQDDAQTGDLLNMSGTDSSNVNSMTQGVNLLDTGAPEPSTLELLTGAADLQNNISDTKPAAVGDAFDPFSDMSAHTKPSTNQNAFNLFASNQPPVRGQSKSKASNFDAFDLLGSGNTSTSKVSQSKNKSDEFLAFMDSKPSNAQSSSKQEDNLMNFGGMNLNLNATSPGFGGSNPNLGIFGSGAGQQQNKSFDRQPSPMTQRDPFADFGE